MISPDTARVRAAVVGTGLIGGSVLLRLRDAGLDVCGWDPDPGTRRYARDRGVPFADDLAGAVRDRDVVFLCGPLSSLPDTLVEVAGLTGGHCVLTDVGSTKSGIAAVAEAHGLSRRFVPGHPMAGTERAGLAAADAGLFDGAAWVLCPSAEGDLGRFRRLARLVVEVFRARVVPMSPAAHDSVVALSSHVAHLLAGSLAGATARSPLRDAVIGLAAGSFRDGTRVAGTPSRRTADMLIDNRSAVLAQLEQVEAFLADLSAALRADDVEALTRCLTESRGLRQALVGRPLDRCAGRFATTGDGTDELGFLLGLGERGGCLTGCVVDADTVTYSVLRAD